MSTTPPESCNKLETTDLQVSANIAEAVKILISKFQDGTIPVKNSSRLQNLTIDDIIKLATSKIQIPDIRNHIITNENNEIINVLEQITNYDIIRDTKFVQSNYIKFKYVDLGTELVPDKYISFHLPNDLVNQDRIVAIYLTTKNDENINILENNVLFEYTIVKDSNDNLNRYLVTVPANKLELGQLEYININNLPSDPSKWGTYGIEKFIKVTYLVDSNWNVYPEEPEPTLGDFDIAKSTYTGPIPMTFGNEPNLDGKPQDTVAVQLKSTNIISYAASEAINGTSLNKYDIIPKSTYLINQNPLSSPIDQDKYYDFLSEVKFLVAQEASSEIIPEKTYKNYMEPKWIIAPMETVEQLFDPKIVTFLKNQKRVINQQNAGVIRSIIDNIDTYNTAYAATYGKEANELLNILLPPNNKVIESVISKVQIITKDIEPYISSSISNKIINEIISKVIVTKATEFFPDSYGDSPNQSTIILKMLTDPDDQTIKIHKYFIPDLVIEEIIHKIVSLDVSTKNHHEVNFIVENMDNLVLALNFTRLLNNPSKVIEQLQKIILQLDKAYSFKKEPTWIPEVDTTTIINPEKQFRMLNETINIIEELKTIVVNYQASIKIKTDISTLIIEQPNLGRENSFSNYPTVDYNLSKGIYNKTNAAKIVTPLLIWPATMVVSSGSVTYLQDIANMKMISSLTLDKEFIPFYTVEDNIQRNTYEFIANDAQRVFDVKTNPYDTTVYREGIRLSRGDYYVNGYRIILKSPANAGETITIISERRYTYSNTVSREELENAIATLKADTPILSYQALTYELATTEIIIENYNPGCIYDISVKFDGTYRDDIAFVRNGDVIYLDIPEIVNIRRASIDLIVYATLPGRIQSTPVTATIQIKNLYDYTVGDSVYRYVVGATPTEWLGQARVKNDSFQNILTSISQYSVIPGDANGPTRIGIVPKSYIQSKLVTTTISDGFKGSYLDAFVGLENLNGIGLTVLSSNGSETIFSNPNYTQAEIEEAFKNNTLWFIVDGSTENNLSSDFLNAVNGPTFGVGTYGTGIRYNFRPAREFMGNIHLLPRTTDTIFMEHIDKLKNRIVRNAIILDLELRVDYDFDTFAQIPETGDAIKVIDIPMESIEYNVQDEVPHLLIKINNTEIPNVVNPYVNSESKIQIPLIDKALTDLQVFDSKPMLQINNLYSERIFSGLKKDMKSTDDMVPLEKLLKFKKFDLGIRYQTNFKNDYFLIEDEDFCQTNALGQKELFLGMFRYQSLFDNKVDNLNFKSRIKAFDPIIPKPKAIRAFVARTPEEMAPNSPYTTDFALVQYGGYSEYLDAAGKVQKVIDSTITFQDIFVADSYHINNSLNPASVISSTDGYHVINGPQKTIRISNIWDVVYRPTLRTNKATELQALWVLIRDGQTNMNDQRWLNITDGLLANGSTEIDISKLVGAEKYRDVEVINNEEGNGFLIFGGVGYKPTHKVITNAWVVQTDISDMATNLHPDAAALQNVYNKRRQERYQYLNALNPTTGKYEYSWVDTGGWFRRIDRLNTRYGWENGEPYIEYSWAKTTYWIEYRSAGADIDHYDVQFRVDRISRAKVINHSIYAIDTTQFVGSLYNLNNNNASHNQVIFRKINPPGYDQIYLDASVGGLVTSPTSPERPVFYDIVKEGNAFWLTIKQAASNITKLFKLTFSSYPSLWAGGAWTFEKDLFSDTDNKITPVVSKWTLAKDGTTTLRGDGPILFKHVAGPDENTDTNTIEGGIYYYDTWDKRLYKKVETTIATSTVVTCIPEIPDIRNPYFLAIDPAKIRNYRIDIVGTRIYLVVYLDKYISNLTKDQFNLFKENILHLNKDEAAAKLANPNKSFRVIPNDFVIGIRTIIPDNDNYRSNSAQIIFNRMETQAGRPAENLVFRLTNTSNRVIELDSVRFSTK